MSYEGYEEYLCKNGHHWSEDCYMAPDKPICPDCKEPHIWRHSVDQTNGIIEDCPGTMSYPLEVDHYEERLVPAYIHRVPIYKIPKSKF